MIYNNYDLEAYMNVTAEIDERIRNNLQPDLVPYIFAIYSLFITW